MNRLVITILVSFFVFAGCDDGDFIPNQYDCYPNVDNRGLNDGLSDDRRVANTRCPDSVRVASEPVNRVDPPNPTGCEGFCGANTVCQNGQCVPTVLGTDAGPDPEPDPEPDAGPPPTDAGAPSDAGSPVDSGTVACNGFCGPGTVCEDGECVLDVSDGGVLPDSGTDSDAGAETDAGDLSDAGPDEDCLGFCGADTVCQNGQCVPIVSETDAGTDSDPDPDAGPPTDDAGPSNDAGPPSEDAGNDSCLGFCGPGTICENGTCVLDPIDPDDGGFSVDSGTDADAGLPADDAGVQTDAGQSVDSGTFDDAGSVDAGTIPCGGFCGPGTICEDGACVIDQIDGGISADAGLPADDAGVQTDAGQSVDSGISDDAGSSVDAGTEPCGGFCGPDTVCESGTCVPKPIDPDDGGMFVDSGTDAGADADAGLPADDAGSDTPGDAGSGSAGDAGDLTDSGPAIECFGFCGPGTICENGTCVLDLIDPDDGGMSMQDAGSDAGGLMDSGPDDSCLGFCGQDTVCENGICVLDPPLGSDDAGPSDPCLGFCGQDTVCENGECIPAELNDAGVLPDAGPSDPCLGFCGQDTVCENGECIPAELNDAGVLPDAGGDTDAGCVIPAFSIGGDRDGDGILDEDDLITVLDADCDGITETVCVATSSMSAPWSGEEAVYQGTPDQWWGGMSVVRLSQFDVPTQVPGAPDGMREWCHDFSEDYETNYIYRYVSVLQDDGATPLAEEDACTEWVVMDIHDFCADFNDELCRYGYYSRCGNTVGFVVGVQWDPDDADHPGISGI